MKIERFNTQPVSPEDTEALMQLRGMIQRATADGKLNRYEIESIRRQIGMDGKWTLEELEIYRELVQSRLSNGELEYDWW